MSAVEIPHPSGCRVYDIRQQAQGSMNLQTAITDGLLSTPKTLPSLLLWDAEGLRLFDEFAHSASYYLRDKELTILRDRSHEIVTVVPAQSILVELGSLQKTGRLIRALEKQQKPVRYYAVDVSLSGLTNSLTELRKELGDLHFVDITGLLGTYDDCVNWISNPSGQDPMSSPTVTFLWMGNSISNLNHYIDSSSLLSQFRLACDASRLRCQFLIAADACQDAQVVRTAYDAQNPTLRAFLLNGLSHANSVLGRAAFSPQDWSCESGFYPEQGQLEVYYVPLRDVELDVGGDRVYRVQRGERVRAISSGKWGKKLMGRVACAAGFQMNHAWGDSAGQYYFYHLYGGTQTFTSGNERVSVAHR
ncbi:hypothetical protein HFD88_000894 [Aspergillus terreus]|uniref:N-methyltransferase benX n=1 Tax=Aspergillus terreus TaxID=33178 RepID=BENX_ASPTE|nr:RecName: Full=N-methyltransferase benX; AltName: Full=Benzomalvin biosynthesis cluster protein X [Aspergillus terreus]AQM58289.1 N-methyltransferase [Shuttle vector AtFAC9J20]KAG2417795.1 hypothetical protein HFD88_000894 [Aspergillus terreus]